MNIKVNPHTMVLTKTELINEGEYNVTDCTFEFSSEYNGLSKVVLFKKGSISKQIELSENHCIIPYEVLEEKGTVQVCVYGYEVEGEDLILRYSPTPRSFIVSDGSFSEGDEPAPPTPSVIEQLQSQITDNRNDIDDIQEDITDINQVLETKANINDLSQVAFSGSYNDLSNKPFIPTKTSDITNDSGYITKSVNNLENYTLSSDLSEVATTGEYSDLKNKPDLSVYATTTQLGNEKTERQNADNRLQEQIDGITASSDVKDIVGTYTDLQNYDTSTLGNNDIIKVLQDSTHNNAMTYYRWDKTHSNWIYIGQEGPYYTKSETNTLMNAKQDLIDGSHKLSSDLVDDTGHTNLFVTSAEKSTWNAKQDSLTFDTTPTENSTNPVTSNGIYESQQSQNETIGELQQENTYINSIIDQLPHVTGEGTSISLNNTLEAKMKIELKGNTSQHTTTGKNLMHVTATSQTKNNVVFTINSDGTILANGKANETSYLLLGSVYLEANTTYFISGCASGGGSGKYQLKLYNRAETPASVASDSGSGISYTPTESGTYDLRLAYWYNWTLTNILFQPMIEVGSSGTSWEEYTGGNPAPNPSYPETINVVSGDNTIKVCGKNLYSGTDPLTERYTYMIPSKIGETYTLSFTGSTIATGGGSRAFLNNHIDIERSTSATDSTFVYLTSTSNSYSLTLTSTINGYLFLSLSSGVSSFSIQNIMLELGDQATTYEPYISQSYPINLGNTELCKIGNYQDKIYKESGKWYLHKEIGKYVYNNDLTFNSQSENTIQFLTPVLNVTPSLNSDTFSSISLCNLMGTSLSNYTGLSGTTSSAKIRINISKSITPTQSDATTLFANKSLTVYYVLATPTTTEITDSELLSQLNALEGANSYNPQTNISQTNNDLPFIITASTLLDLNSLITRIETLEA